MEFEYVRPRQPVRSQLHSAPYQNPFNGLCGHRRTWNGWTRKAIMFRKTIYSWKIKIENWWLEEANMQISWACSNLNCLQKLRKQGSNETLCFLLLFLGVRFLCFLRSLIHVNHLPSAGCHIRCNIFLIIFILRLTLHILYRICHIVAYLVCNSFLFRTSSF